MTNAEILVIDDEVQIRKLLRITLESNEFKVMEASTGKDGMIAAASHPPALILLDIGLPDESGHSILQKIREWYSKPIIILSVQNDEENIVKALDNGANDYLVKPFRTGELLARIRSAIRSSALEENNPILNFGTVQIDLAARLVKKNNEVLKMTSTEFSLLAMLSKNEGRVLTHQFLLKEIWGPGYQNQTQYLRVFVAQLRKKIEDDANHPKYILTESGVGYRFSGAYQS